MTIKLAQPDLSGGWKRGIEVEAEEVKIHPEVRFAVHQSHIYTSYVVTHIDSGFAVGYGETKKEAIKNAKEKISKYNDLKNTLKALLKKHSYSVLR